MPARRPCNPGEIPCRPVRVRLPIANAVEVALRGHSTSGQWVNTHQYHVNSAISGPVLTSIANAVIAQVGPKYLSYLPNTYFLDDVRVSDLQVPTALAVVQPFPPGSQGGAVGNPLPASAAAAMSYHTGLSGRSYRGRQYFPVGIENNTINDTLTPSFLAAANNAAVAWNTITPSATSVVPVVASITKGVATNIIAHVIDSIVDSMRRRLQGRGR